MVLHNVWLRRYSKLTVFTTLGLIFIGALVKSFEAGLSVPDWPTTYGYQMFLYPLSDMVGGIFYEHTHRLLATVVGTLTLLLAVWISIVEKRKNVKRLGYIALILVIVQGLLGGMTVLFFLPTIISLMHGITAQTFFMILILIAYSLSKEYSRSQQNHDQNKKIVLSLLITIYIQLILGAWMRHTNSGLAIYDFPTMAGYWLPPFNETMMNNINDWRFENNLDLATIYQVVIHFLHRISALIVLVLAIFLGYKLKKNETGRRIKMNVVSLYVLLSIQIFLGMLTIWTLKEPFITSFHVVNGAAVLGACFILFLRSSNLSFLDH